MNIFYLDRDPEIAAQMHCDKHVVKMILEKWKCMTNIEIVDNENEPFESETLQIVPSKANKILEWKNVYSVEEAVVGTISWYKVFFENPEEIEQKTIQDIEDYVLKAVANNLIWSMKRE